MYEIMYWVGLGRRTEQFTDFDTMINRLIELHRVYKIINVQIIDKE